MGRVKKYQMVAEHIAELIRTGVFGPGEALPSVRELSRQQKVSVSTVLQAYYDLESQGLLRAKARSGFFVSTRPPNSMPEPAMSAPEPDPTKVDLRELTTMVMLRDAQNPDLTHLGAAYPPPEMYAAGKLNRIMCSIARRMGDASGDYLLPPGAEILRTQIARHLAEAGCKLSAKDIVITSGCNDAISLCFRSVLKPGDTIAIESPICFDTLHSLEPMGLKVLEIPTCPRDGISLDALGFALDHNQVSACLVISNFNNPLGSRMPDGAKKELVEMLAGRDIPLIEDEIFGEVYYGDQRPITCKAFDEKGMVMLCSSFSKTLCPGYRVGWVAPGRFQKDVEWHKYNSGMAAATLPQYAIGEFMAGGGGYRRHMQRIRQVYERNMASMWQAVIRYLPKGIKMTRPTGGFLLWLELPPTVDALELYKMALKEKIAIVPGQLFSPTDRYKHFFRLNTARWNKEVEDAVRRLGRIIESMMHQ